MSTYDYLLKCAFDQRNDGIGCDYQGYEFGATYPDSVCIDGFLWDADSGDASPDGEGWIHTNGGDLPCPWCNHEEWIAGATEELESTGFNDFHRGTKRDDGPQCGRFESCADDLRAAWLKGWDEAASVERQ